MTPAPASPRPRANAQLLNPWSPRLPLARSSQFITHCPVHDPRAELEAGRVITAPSFSEARRLGELRLGRLHTDAKIDRREGGGSANGTCSSLLRNQGFRPCSKKNTCLSDSSSTARDAGYRPGVGSGPRVRELAITSSGLTPRSPADKAWRWQAIVPSPRSISPPQKARAQRGKRP